MKFYLLCIVLVASLLYSCTQPNTSLSLNGTDWKFSKVGKENFQPATVPGTVQTDLLKLGQIPDPFLLNNEDSIQWISKLDWVYRKTFSVPKKQLIKKRHLLKFEGLDTYAEIFLNDSLLVATSNAFRTFEVDVSTLLKEENTLYIVFHSTDQKENEAKRQLDYELPESPRVFTRKPQFQYGWDWGPKIKTVGIWRDVSLLSFDNIRLEDAFLKTEHITDTLATLSAIINLQTPKYDNCFIEVRNKTTNETFTFSAEVYGPSSEYSFEIPVKNPKLWWTHNLGEPFLYDFSIRVKKNNVIIDSMSKRVGIRDVQLMTPKDSVGERFYFKLNGIPVYMKGANYIPQHIFLPEVSTKDRETLLNAAIEANMNMLRVWGGGVYEDDEFYQLCDEKGMLLWQDFMFACAMYPGDTSFLENVKKEAIDNVKRLRQHPSIALWCGNNENSEGWHRWGWQADKTEAQKEEIWNNYQKVFNEILPTVVDSLHPSISYWESSPKYGRGDPRYQFEGDAHDWWVWHDGYPFEHFEEAVPRFMSEFGFQSFPSYETMQYFTQADSINISHPSVASHQKHVRGFQLINEYMEHDFVVPQKDSDYVYVSQLLQAYGISKGILAHRRAKPYNMGTLYWQLNDCWPAISWSSIDGLGNWKALHYKAKRAFANTLIVPNLKNDTLNIWLVNDSITPITETLSVKIKDFNGTVLKEVSKANSTVGTTASELKLRMPLNEIDAFKNNTVAEISFGEAQALYYFVKPKELKLTNEAIQVTQIATDRSISITLSAETLQKDVFLVADVAGHFSDNFFDLLPGEAKTVQFFPNEKVPTVTYINTLNRIKNNIEGEVPSYSISPID
ncbi:MAG TPA: glycoside hydrolase family 2 protein [Flavobacteriaceae bacterium]|nr:glycoside hydrolase family 2 protein [Flavobacteriaceae bacterium]HIN98399.1 glycoside hydrolase family 2 protein [Flavobacteriaceae bacterium]